MKTWQSHGFKCLAKINQTGTPVGYVGLPQEHPDFGKHYDDIEDVEVHGGLTFAGYWQDQADDLWYVGFDCGHAWDMNPFLTSSDDAIPRYTSNKSLDYVEEETERLAEQMDKRR